MKLAYLLTLLPVSMVLALACWAVFSASHPRAVAAPPLSLEGLLDEKLPEAPSGTEKPEGDDFFCYVCHGNYKAEEFVLWHGKGEVGCIDCHGPSLAHRDDEDNITPPDKMYAPEHIDKMCGACHKDHEAPAASVIARWKERCPSKTDPMAIFCTDCHVTYRLKFRTV